MGPEIISLTNGTINKVYPDHPNTAQGTLFPPIPPRAPSKQSSSRIITDFGIEGSSDGVGRVDPDYGHRESFAFFPLVNHDDVGIRPDQTRQVSEENGEKTIGDE